MSWDIYFSYPSGLFSCHLQASAIIFSRESNCGFQPNTLFAFSDEAINVAGSPARLSFTSAGIEWPVTFLTVSSIVFCFVYQT